MSRPMVVIPTYNEIDNVEHVTRAILDLPLEFDVLLVDDNSPDGTGALADKLASSSQRVQVLHREKKEGIGPAYIDGFRHALRCGASAILQMDADLSHDPSDLPRLYAGLAEADVVIGSRYNGGVRVLDWSIKRLALSLSASLYVKSILRMPIDDPTGGFKCWRPEVLKSLALDHMASRGYSFQIEMSYRAWRRGFRLKEVPIIFQERLRGGSKISKNIIYEAIYVLWRIRLQPRYDARLPMQRVLMAVPEGDRLP